MSAEDSAGSTPVAGASAPGGDACSRAASASPLDAECLLAQIGARMPSIAVLTVFGRWVPCVVHPAGFNTDLVPGRTVPLWHAHPVDEDLRRNEVIHVWDDSPPWALNAAVIQFSCEHEAD